MRRALDAERLRRFMKELGRHAQRPARVYLTGGSTAVGPLAFYHYDPYAQTLSKIERGHAKDVADVRMFLNSGLVDRERLRALFEEAVPRMARYPSLDPDSFRQALEEALRE